MRVEKTWSAGSECEEIQRGRELAHMAGLWNAAIQVRITKPYVFSRGSLERKAVQKKEIGRKHKGTALGEALD
jgi:hypothetical protein